MGPAAKLGGRFSQDTSTVRVRSLLNKIQLNAVVRIFTGFSTTIAVCVALSSFFQHPFVNVILEYLQSFCCVAKLFYLTLRH